MDFKQFTIKSQEAIQKAAELAISSGQPSIETAHLLKGIFSEDENVTEFVFKKLGANKQLASQKLEELLGKLPKVSGGNQQPYLSNSANQALTKAKDYLKTFGDEYSHPKFKGEILNGKPNGTGTLTYSDGKKYMGEWKNGEPNGLGIFSSPDGGKYEGEWENEEMEGQGIFTLPDGMKYMGEFKNGKNHGQWIIYCWAVKRRKRRKI